MSALFGEAATLRGDAATAHDRFVEAGGVVVRWDGRVLQERLAARDGRTLVVIEALFGTGLTRDCDAVLEVYDSAADGLDLNAVRTVAVDIPAGISSDTGRLLGRARLRCRSVCHVPSAQSADISSGMRLPGSTILK